jgi:hypothetical protein
MNILVYQPQSIALEVSDATMCISNQLAQCKPEISKSKGSSLAPLLHWYWDVPVYQGLDHHPSRPVPVSRAQVQLATNLVKIE